jgi:CRP/FNR family transcriptional regulator, cyclic AMP receptor protein
VSLGPSAHFARTKLFEGLSEAELAEIATVTFPWRATEGGVLFHQGDAGDRLLVVTAGELQASARLPTGDERLFATVGPGDIVGELALLAGGRRTANVRAVTDSAGFALTRQTFELLRLQLRPVAQKVVRKIGEVSLERLGARYAALAGDLGEAMPAQLPIIDNAAMESGDFSSNGVPDSYLQQILFFRRFTPGEIVAIRKGLRVFTAPRDARLDLSDSLWIVLRGAVQTAVVRGGVSQRVRLSGPGRCVGHLGLLPEREHRTELVATMRERAVLLEVPHERAHTLLAGDLPGAQRFAEAFHEDVVRALLAAEEQLAPPLALV